MGKEPVEKVGQGSKRVPCEIFSRICGYLRPTFAWNKGKQQEFKERKYFKVTTDEETKDE